MCLISRSLRLKLWYSIQEMKRCYIILKYLLMNNSSNASRIHSSPHKHKRKFLLSFHIMHCSLNGFGRLYIIYETHTQYSQLSLSFFLQITTFRFSSYCFFVFHFSSTFSWFNFTNSIW